MVVLAEHGQQSIRESVLVLVPNVAQRHVQHRTELFADRAPAGLITGGELHPMDQVVDLGVWSGLLGHGDSP